MAAKRDPSLTRNPLAYSVADLLEWYRGGLLELNPEFQRRSIWKPGARSFLIDTILRGLPVPPIILRELKTNLKTLERRREVVDGQQRLRALIAFVMPASSISGGDSFTLSESHQPHYKDKAFRDLPDDMQTSILEYMLHVNVLPSTTTNKEVLDIFSRLNATGTKLSAQELRNAEYYGYFKTISFGLASDHLDFWKKHGLFSDTDFTRMREVEFTSDLLLMMLNGITGLSQAKLNAAYKDNDANSPFAKLAPPRFRKVMSYIDKHFPFSTLNIFSNKTMFYPLFAVVYAELFAKHSKSGTVSKILWGKILSHAARMQDGSVPKAVASSMESQPTNLKERRTLASYLRHGS